MKGNDAFRVRHDAAGYPLDARRNTTPWGTRVHVKEDRSREANRTENVRQHVHATPAVKRPCWDALWLLPTIGQNKWTVEHWLRRLRGIASVSTKRQAEEATML